MNKAYLRDALLVAGGVVLGSGISVLVTKKVLDNKYEDRLVNEIADIRESYKRAAANTAAKAATPPPGWVAAPNVFVKVSEDAEAETLINRDAEELRETIEKVVETVLEYQGVEEKSETEEEDDEDEEQRDLEHSAQARVDYGRAAVRNIFAERDKAKEEEKPEEHDPEVPYIITVNEFMQGEQDFEKITVTYYEGDEVLVDERDEVIHDLEGTVSSSCLNFFGQGSNDDSIVYVRNEKLEVDFEVVRHQGRYTVVVLGMDDEDQERPKKRSRKPRDDD